MDSRLRGNDTLHGTIKLWQELTHKFFKRAEFINRINKRSEKNCPVINSCNFGETRKMYDEA
jgi:hypothetical protein